MNEIQKKYPEYDVCVPVGLRSELFGNPESLQLEISAWKCVETEGVAALYFFQTVFLKDALPVSTAIPPDGVRP